MGKFLAVSNIVGMKGGDISAGQVVTLKDKEAAEMVAAGALVSMDETVSPEIAQAEVVAEVVQEERDNQ